MITKSNQHIRRLFEGSCYTKDWSNDGDYCESHRNKWYFKENHL